jgi:hypothetical protein
MQEEGRDGHCRKNWCVLREVGGEEEAGRTRGEKKNTRQGCNQEKGAGSIAEYQRVPVSSGLLLEQDEVGHSGKDDV